MKNDRDNNRAWLLSGLFGILTGSFLAFGYQLEKLDRIDLSDRNLLLILGMLIVIITMDTRYIWRGYNLALEGRKLFGFISLPVYRDTDLPGKRDFFINWGCMIILSIPVFMAEFPGFFVYDAADELNEVLTRTFTTHHPLLHVLLLGGIIALVHKVTGSWNAGIFTYLVLQMLVMTAIYAYAITYMQKKGIGKKSRIFWVLFYGAFPTIVMYTLCSCKDGLFSALLLLLTVLLLKLTEDPKAFAANRKDTALFILTATVMPLFRHNGFYAYLVFVPFALIHFRKSLKSLLTTMLIAPVVLYLVISPLLSAACHVSEGTHHQEMLTVPIMQLARVYAYEKDELTNEDIEAITAYIPEENLEKYTPRLSDLVKLGFNNELYEHDSAGFWKVWKKLALQHPMTYLNAWMLTSYGYVYPPAVINVYKGNSMYTFTYEDSSYFGYEVEVPGERKSMLKPLDELYRYLSIGTFQSDLPVIHLFFSPGLYVILFMFVLLYRVYRRNYKGILPFLPMVLTFCTVLLGPTYLVRYVLYLWLIAPLLQVSGRFD